MSTIYELYDRFATEAEEVCTGSRDLTVMPRFLKSLSTDEFEQRQWLGRTIWEHFSNDVSPTMCVYWAGIQAEAKRRKDTRPHSVFLVEDWSSGQYYNFLMPVDGQEPYLNMMLEAAQEALEKYPHLLSSWGREVANNLVIEIPRFLSGVIETTKPTQQPVQKPRAGWVYLLQSSTGAYKIGLSKNPASRLATFGVQLPFDVEFTCLIKTDDMRRLEAELHDRFKDQRVRGEWFNLSHDDVDYVKGLAT